MMSAKTSRLSRTARLTWRSSEITPSRRAGRPNWPLSSAGTCSISQPTRRTRCALPWSPTPGTTGSPSRSSRSRGCRTAPGSRGCSTTARPAPRSCSAAQARSRSGACLLTDRSESAVSGCLLAARTGSAGIPSGLRWTSSPRRAPRTSATSSSTRHAWHSPPRTHSLPGVPTIRLTAWRTLRSGDATRLAWLSGPVRVSWTATLTAGRTCPHRTRCAVPGTSTRRRRPKACASPSICGRTMTITGCSASPG